MYANGRRRSRWPVLCTTQRSENPISGFSTGHIRFVAAPSAPDRGGWWRGFEESGMMTR
jgi:hypothetical protein